MCLSIYCRFCWVLNRLKNKKQRGYEFFHLTRVELTSVWVPPLSYTAVVIYRTRSRRMKLFTWSPSTRKFVFNGFNKAARVLRLRQSTNYIVNCIPVFIMRYLTMVFLCVRAPLGVICDKFENDDGDVFHFGAAYTATATVCS